MSTLLRGGRIVDGTGASSYAGDVLLEGTRIERIVRDGEPPAEADEVIDVRGKVVAPGFIDMHSHIDFLLPRDDHDRLVRCFLEQGVTSVVAGNCGISPAPVREATRPRLEAFASIVIDRPLSWAWTSMDEYLTHLDATKPAVNVAQLVGHSSLRYAATDKKRGELSSAELARCREETARALDEGACGVSFGLGYDPGMYSSMDELVAFSEVAAKRGRPVTSHLKAYSWLSPVYPLTEWRAHNVRAVREMLEVADRSGATLQISHLIFVGRNTWRTAGRVLDMIDTARNRGQDVMFDAFPYTCGNTTINVTLPYWFLAMGRKGHDSRLARLRCRAEMELGYRLVGFDWSDFQVMEIGEETWQHLNGLTLTEIARRWRMSAFDAMLRIGARTDGGALMLIHNYSGDRHGRGPIQEVLQHEACLFETDAAVRSSGWPNPATMGTFPKILGDLVRDQKRLELEAVIARATDKSAARFGIRDRGRIEEGLAADVVVFDPDTIRDTPPQAGAPAGRPQGVEHVFVNGAHAVRGGEYQGTCAGRVLRA